jgi:hypothetical protein
MVIAAASSGKDRLDIFRRSATTGGNLFHQAWDGQQWRPGPAEWENIGGELYSDPIAVRSGSECVRLLATGPDNSLMTKQLFYGSWQPGPLDWEILGDKLVGTPAMVSRTDDVLAVFYFGLDGNLYLKHKDDLTGWRAAEKVGGKVAGPGKPVAVCSPVQPNRFDAFFVGPNRNLLHKQWYFGELRPAGNAYENLGGELHSDPAVVSWAEDRIDVFAIGPNGNLLHKFWDGQHWLPGQTQWDNMGGKMRGTPTAVSRGPGLIDVLVTGPDNKLFYIGNNGFQWSRLIPMFGSATTGEPTAVTWGPKRIDVFYLHGDHVYQRPHDGTGWREEQDHGGAGL